LERDLRNEALGFLKELGATSKKELEKKLGVKGRKSRIQFDWAVKQLKEEKKIRKIYDEIKHEEMLTLEPEPQTVQIDALHVLLGSEEKVPVDAYLFAIDASTLRDAVQIRPIEIVRGHLFGEQRLVVDEFIDKKIKKYIQTDPIPLIPDAVLVQMTPSVSIMESKETENIFNLSFKWSRDFVTEERPFILLDGQQRLEAVRRSKVALRVPVVAFDQKVDAKKLFLIANTKQPLKPAHIRELWREIEKLPAAMKLRADVSKIVDRLDTEDDSPFFGIIRSPARIVGDRFVEFATFSEALRECFEGTDYLPQVKECKAKKRADKFFLEFCRTDEGADVNTAVKALKACFKAVKETFPDAWARPPRESKLMHTAGIRAILQFLAYLVADRGDLISGPEQNLYEYLVKSLESLKGKCYWTKESWERYGEETKRSIGKLQELTSKAKQAGWSEEDIKSLEEAVKARGKELQYFIWKDVSATFEGVRRLFDELITKYEARS